MHICLFPLRQVLVLLCAIVCILASVPGLDFILERNTTPEINTVGVCLLVPPPEAFVLFNFVAALVCFPGCTQ